MKDKLLVRLETWSRPRARAARGEALAGRIEEQRKLFMEDMENNKEVLESSICKHFDFELFVGLLEGQEEEEMQAVEEKVQEK